MNTELVKYSINHIYSDLKNLNGPRIDISNGLIKLWVSFENITFEELSSISSLPFLMSLKTFESMCMIYFNFSGCVLETPYNQFEVKHGFLEVSKLPENQGIPLLILAGESRTGELKKIRVCSLPHAFSVQFIEILNQQWIENIGSYTLAEFNALVDQYFENTSVEEAFVKPGEREVSCIINSCN